MTELIPNFNTSDNTVAQDVLDASAALIQKWCNRTFAVTSYDELYDGQGTYNLLLDNYPIVYVDRIMYNYSNMLMIRNTDNTRTRASFRLDGTTDVPPKPNNLYLVDVKNGVTTTNTVTIAGNNSIQTYNDLATAINAFSASGWNAVGLGTYGTFAMSECRPPQGADECRWFGAAYLKQHAFGFPDYTFRQETGEVVAPLGFTRGYQNYRVVYNAGFSTIPNEVVQACAELAVASYQASRDSVNSNLSNQNIGGYSYANIVEKNFNSLSIASRYALYQYKNTRVVKFKIY